MALTRITKGVIKPNENYDTHNINSTGIVTAIGLDVNGNGDISGNLNVGGVLTYEDVTSIDSVGIITAQKDIHVGAGVSVVGIVTAATFKGDGDFVDLDVDGHTNLDNVSVAGVTTITSSTYPLNVHADTTYQGIIINGNVCPTVNFARNNSTTPEWKLGLSGHDSDNFSISLGGTSNDRLVLRSNSATINGSYLNVNNLMVDSKVYHSADTNNFFLFGTDIQYFYTNNAERLKIENSGIIVTGVSTFSASAHVSNANGSVFFGAGNATAYGSQGGIGRASDAGYHIGGSGVGDLCIAAEGSKRILFGTKTGTGIGGITKRMSISSDGTVTIDGNLDAVGGIDATSNSTFAGDIDVDGHTNLDNVSIAGVTTMTGNLSMGETLTVSGNNPNLTFTDTNSNPDFKIYGSNGTFSILDSTNSVNRFVINSVGNISISNDLDVDGHTNLDNVSVAGVTTFTGNANFGSNGLISSAANFSLSSNALTVTGSNTVGIECRRASNATIQCTDTTNSTDLQLRANSSGGLVRTASNTALNLGTFQKNRIQITNDGKVQIGLPGSSTSLPGAVEVVNIRAMTDGNLCIRAIGSISGAPSGSGVGIDVLNDANNAVKDLALRGSTIIFKNASNESARIDSSGRVMIGRTSAQKKFNVRETSTSSGVYYNAHIAGASHLVNYAIGIGFDPEGYEARTKMALVAEGTSQGYSRGKFHFLLDAANDSGEATLSESRMTITDAGKVGINETSPDTMLHLKGGVPAITLEDTDGTYGQAIIEQNGDNLKIRQDAGNASSGSSSNIRFEIDAAEKLRIENLGDNEYGLKFFDNKAIEFKSQDSGIFTNTWYINANTWTNFFSIPDYFQAWMFLNGTHNAGNSSALWSISKSASGGAHCNRYAHDNLYGPATVTFRINGVWVQIKSSYATYGYAIINATAGGNGVANLSG